MHAATLGHIMIPTLTISDLAAEALRNAIGDSGEVVHVAVSASFDHALEIGAASSDAMLVTVNGISIAMDPESAPRAEGMSIDFVDGPNGAGFRIDNPNAPPKITEIDGPELKARLASGDIEHFVDVRTVWERELAKLPSSFLLDDDSSAKLAGLDKDTPIAFYCHHGSRSRAAATHYLNLGFTKLYNLTGGIDAWSQLVDVSVPRY
tara:strand:- start:2 stop:622 length:621 start_codon:yes stop_codon:yes gene_type:complete